MMFVYMLIAMCLLHCGEFFEIPLMRQTSPRNSLHRLPSSYKPIIDDLFKPKPKPGNESVPLFRYLDSEFYGVVGIGKPVRYFNLIFDTVWGNSWVLSDACPLQQMACWWHNKYDGTKSFTHVDNGTEFSVNENSYNISGFISIDDIHIAHLTVSQFAFAEITSLPWIYSLSKADGILGMALKDLAVNGSPSFFYQLVRQSVIPQPIFSVFINRDRQSNRGGTIFLGGIQKKHFNGTFTYLSNTSPYYWQFKMDRVVMPLQNKTFGFCLNGCSGVVDTSSNAIVGPSLELRKINRLIKARLIAYGRYAVDCDTLNKLPPISFVLAGREFVLKGEHYTQKVSYFGLEICISCFQPMANNVGNKNTWMLGGAFLGEYYSTYDLAKNRIGFANAL